MRLISQDGTTDIPYELFTIQLTDKEEDLGEQYRIDARIQGKIWHAMARYDTRSEAVKALNSLWNRLNIGGALYRFPKDKDTTT